MRPLKLALCMALLTACGANDWRKEDKETFSQEPLEGLLPAEEGLETITAFSAASAALENLAPPSFAIDAITLRGKGCPEGSTAVFVSPDKKAFTLYFDHFLIALDPDDRTRQLKATCVIDLKFSAPRGWAFGILGIDTRGFADLDAGVQARERLAVLTKSRGFRTLAQKIVTGPVTDGYLSSRDIPLRSALWTTCQSETKRLVLSASLFMKGRPGQGGLISVDSIDGEAAQNYRIGWRRC